MAGSSESLHYAYTMLIVAGIVVLIPAVVGTAKKRPVRRTAGHAWHNVEHTLLLFQRRTGQASFGAGGPTSIERLWLPRVELHFFDNMVVLVPLLVALAIDSRSRQGMAASAPAASAALPKAG